MEQRCVQLLWKWLGKKYYVTLHCQANLFPKGFSQISLYFFTLDFESKKKEKWLSSFYFLKLRQSLKANRLHQQVRFCVPLVVIDSVLAYVEMHCSSPHPWNLLIHSRRGPFWETNRNAPVNGKWLTAGIRRRYRTLLIIPGSKLGAAPSWEPSPWKHEKNKKVFFKIKKKKKGFSSSSVLILEEKKTKSY